MAEAEEIIRSYHQAFLTRIDAAVRDVKLDGEPAFSGALSSLGEDVIRYIQANEVSLYPAVAPLVRSDEEVMAPMIFDIRAIDERINEAEELTLLAPTAPPEAQREVTEKIERLTAQIEALIRVHIEKLERLYLPLLREMTPEQRQTILDRLAAEYGPPPEWPEAVPVASVDASQAERASPRTTTG